MLFTYNAVVIRLATLIVSINVVHEMRGHETSGLGHVCLSGQYSSSEHCCAQQTHVATKIAHDARTQLLLGQQFCGQNRIIYRACCHSFISFIHSDAC